MQNLYEINIRTFLRRFDSGDKKATVKDIPLTFWKGLAEKGIDLVWLMGVWETCDSVISNHCFQEGLVSSYDRALKQWSKEDVIGSPYAINQYKINNKLGSTDEFIFLRKVLHSLGIKLIFDFVPNHFSVDSIYTNSNPEYFLQGTMENLEEDRHTFFISKHNPELIFAHGRDPFFPAWTDTIQLNYYNPQTRKFMSDTLLEISEYCDGVRCDMSMLILNNIFFNTWRGIIDTNIFCEPTSEFWEEAITSVKKKNNNFVLIAETYWDLEWNLQQLGFDYTYDKKLLDRLKDGTTNSIRDHLKADLSYQLKSVRFIENHDEDRAIQTFGLDKSLAASVIISTIPGLHLYFEGQFCGYKIKLPIQLGREPIENGIKTVKLFYDSLLNITKDEIFKKGKWQLVEAISSWENNLSNNNIIAYNWSFNNQNRLVVVNYSNAASQCRIKLNVEGYEENFQITDLLNETTYWRNTEEVFHSGLYIELQPFKSHIFAY
ncbi:MAG: glycosidase [Ignavibacteriaceae bacterium]|nr:glycosidase [Ignavibacteriaceae bacterium]